jgi:hypothetical protein
MELKQTNTAVVTAASFYGSWSVGQADTATLQSGAWRPWHCRLSQRSASLHVMLEKPRRFALGWPAGRIRRAESAQYFQQKLS